MTAVVHSELHELEEVIERGLATFVEVGTALAKIRDGRLYDVAHGGAYLRLEDYCQDRWGWGRNYANRLIRAAQVTERLVPMGTTAPKIERLARPLTKIKEPEQQAQAWARAQEIAAHDNRKVIAADVEEAVAEVMGGAVKPTDDRDRLPRHMARLQGHDRGADCRGVAVCDGSTGERCDIKKALREQGPVQLPHPENEEK